MSQSGETSQTSPLTTRHHQRLEKYKAVGPKQAQALPQKGQKDPSLPPTLLEETRQNQKAAKPKKQRQKISFRSTKKPIVQQNRSVFCYLGYLKILHDSHSKSEKSGKKIIQFFPL
jgi:hypothetical protein